MLALRSIVRRNRAMRFTDARRRDARTLARASCALATHARVERHGTRRADRASNFFSDGARSRRCCAK
jgi:hypothetical protein